MIDVNEISLDDLALIESHKEQIDEFIEKIAMASLIKDADKLGEGLGELFVLGFKIGALSTNDEVPNE